MNSIYEQFKVSVDKNLLNENSGQNFDNSIKVESTIAAKMNGATGLITNNKIPDPSLIFDYQFTYSQIGENSKYTRYEVILNVTVKPNYQDKYKINNNRPIMLYVNLKQKV